MGAARGHLSRPSRRKPCYKRTKPDCRAITERATGECLTSECVTGEYFTGECVMGGGGGVMAEFVTVECVTGECHCGSSQYA